MVLQNIFSSLYTLIFLIISIKQCISDPGLIFPQSTNLLNGDILIIHKNGIDIYDSSFNKKQTIINKTNFIGDVNSLSKITISKFFNDTDVHIISTINDKIFIFNYKGELKYNTSNQLDELKGGKYYTLIPIKKENDNYYTYMIGFIDNDKINLIFYQYDNNKNNSILRNINISKNEYKIYGEGFSCQLMNNDTNQEIVVCFFYINDDNNKRRIGNILVDINNYSIINSSKNFYNLNNDRVPKAIRSVVTSDKKKSLVCFHLQDTFSICLNYSIDDNSFSLIYNSANDCANNNYFEINSYYIRETNQFLYICANNQKTSLIYFDQNFTYLNTYIISTSNIEGFSVVYSYTLKNYVLISDDENNKGNKSKIFYEYNSTKIEYVNSPVTLIFPTIPTTINNNSTYISTTNIKSTSFSYISNSTVIINNLTHISSHISSTNIISTFFNNISNLTTTTINNLTHISTTNIKSNSFYNISNLTTTTNNLISISTINIKNNSFSYISNSITTINNLSYISTTYIKNNTSPIIPNSSISSNINVEKITIKKENLINELPSIIDKIKIGQIYQKIGEDYSILIYPTNSTDLTSMTHVNFSECENKLRKHYKIPDSDIMTFLQIEIENEDTKSLINQVEYQAYDGNKTLLDLSICDDVNIKIFYNIKNNSLIDLNSANSFKDLGVDIFNINDSFFNDICEPYSDSNNDLILEDRIKDIYQNYSLCEEGCTYKGIDLENMTLSCECNVKENVSTVLSPIKLEEVEGSSTNFDLVKCYNLVFSFEGKLNNIGFWIFSLLLLAHFPILFYYFTKGIKPVKEYIIKEMEKYGYIKDNKNKNELEVTDDCKKNKKCIKRKKKMHKSTNASPPKNKNNKSNIKKKSSIKSLHIKNLKIVDNTSSINFLKMSNKEIIPNINDSSNNNNENNSNNKSKIKFMKTNKSKYKAKKLANIPTQTLPQNKNDENEKIKKLKNFSLININLNLSRHQKYIPPESHIILNNYNFEEAIKYDLRQLCVIFYIFALSKQIIFHTFLFRSPLELFPLRLCLFIFIISCDLALNALFYFNDNISKKYRCAKNLFLFTFSDNITVIILSTFVGFILLTLLAKLSNSTTAICNVFRREEEKIKKNKKYIITEKRKKEIILEIDEILRKYKLKVIILIIIELILMIFFWYFVTAFCHVYVSTQISWLLDSFLSIISRAIIELLISLGLAKLYRIAIDSEIHCLYKIAMFLYNFG